MSDDDRDFDIESAERRAHHNALERKRRDHIKDSFSSLRDSVPGLQGEKVASRAQILKKAADYIQSMRRRHLAHQQDIDDLKRQNNLLEAQIRTLERARLASGTYAEEDANFTRALLEENDTEETESSGAEDEPTENPPKKRKEATT